jgi:hypothetical protein
MNLFWKTKAEEQDHSILININSNSEKPYEDSCNQP